MSTRWTHIKLLLASAACLSVAATVGVLPAAAEPGGDPPPKATPARGFEAAGVAAVERMSSFWKSPGFGNVTADFDRNVVTVLWKGDPPAAVTHAAEGLQNSGINVEFKPAEFSQHEMDAAGARVLDAERSRSGTAKATAFIPNEELTGATVELFSGSRAAQDVDAAAAMYSAAAGFPVAVQLVDWERMPLTRQNDSAPWQGGGAIQQNNLCSTGFAIVRSDGTGRLLTAAHCGLTSGETVRDGNGDVIGTISNVSNTWDSALIDPSASPATIGKVFGGPWNAGTSHSRYQFFVGGASAPSGSDTPCTSGAMSGEHCNRDVYQTGITFPCGPNLNYTCNGFRIRGSGITAAQGDSGGPVYIMRNDGRVGARGIIANGIGTLTSCPSGSTAEPDTICASAAEIVGIHHLLDFWKSYIET